MLAESVAKRWERMQDAAQKGAFHISQTQQLRVKKDEKVVFVKMWEIWSNHTHRAPRMYLVSKAKDDTGKVVWRCTCPDFQQNGNWIPCKHILYVQMGGVE